MKRSDRVFAAIKPCRNVSQYATQCEAIVDRVDGNPYLPNPTPAPSVVRDHIKQLRALEKAARGGPAGSAAARDIVLARLRSDMNQLKAAVQAAADQNQEESRAIIESTGMSVAKQYTRTSAPIAVRYGKVPGLLFVVAKSVGRRATYYWQVSTNQADWSDLPETVVATTSIEGLTAATIYYFRVRTLTRAGLSEWSMVARVIAH
jgi:hypothetical protein